MILHTALLFFSIPVALCRTVNAPVPSGNSIDSSLNVSLMSEEETPPHKAFALTSINNVCLSVALNFTLAISVEGPKKSL